MSTLLIKLLAGAALLAGAVWAYHVWAGHYDARGYARAVSEYKAREADALAQLAAANKATRAAEAATLALRGVQDLKDAENAKNTSALALQLASAKRLRDPHAGAGASCDARPAPQAGTAGNSQSDPAETPGLLSAQLTGLLQKLMLEADTVNDAYASCRTQP